MTSIKILLESATAQAEVIPIPKSVRIDQCDQFDSFSLADALRLSGNPVNYKIYPVKYKFSSFFEKFFYFKE